MLATPRTIEELKELSKGDLIDLDILKFYDNLNTEKIYEDDFEYKKLNSGSTIIKNNNGIYILKNYFDQNVVTDSIYEDAHLTFLKFDVSKGKDIDLDDEIILRSSEYNDGPLISLKVQELLDMVR